MSKKTCPECGAGLEDDVCPECGWGKESSEEGGFEEEVEREEL